jgi:tripeptidyl-peptidase I
VGEENTDDLDGFLDTVNFLLNETAPPQVLTTSYGPNEDDVSWALTKYDATRLPAISADPCFSNICNAYAQIGARGTSILYASGYVL